MKITTYKQLFALIRDEQADSQLRADICEEIRRLFVWIDRRRFVPPLLDALKTRHEPLLNNAIQALGNLESKQAAPIIAELVKDKTLSTETRNSAALALMMIGDVRAIPALLGVMLDSTDDLKVREDAIEHTAWFSHPSLVTSYIKLLSDPIVDMRFWAAYGFAIMRTDISEAISDLDRVAAFDHNAPDGWWHVDREAFDALENIYWQQIGLGNTEVSRKYVHIISPAPEYMTFSQRFNRLPPQEYKKLKPPSLKIDGKWFVEKLLEDWAGIKLNVREPRPQTYLVDWLVEINGEPLIGGLHRDQYTVVVTGSLKTTVMFAAWYRLIVKPEEYLFLYEWAAFAVELRPDMSVETIEKAYMNSTNGQKVNYPWIIETE